MIVYLDGIEVQYPNDSLLEPKFSLRRSTQSEGAAISFTGDLEFTGTDYDYIYSTLVTDTNGINNSIILKFVDDCCSDKEYLFIIKPESLEWCEGKCTISANALEYSVDSNAYACFENTLIWGNSTVNPPATNFEDLPHPRIAYCLEYRPSLLQDIVLIIVIATSFTAYFVYIIAAGIQSFVNSVNLLITAFNAIPLVPDIPLITFGGSADPNSLLNLVDEYNDKISKFAVGCGYDHPSPLVRTYVNNVCNQCKVSFQSSILNDSTQNPEYYKLVYFSAQVRKGQTAFDTKRNYLQTNKPILNGKQFLDQLVQPFNARWDIHNNVLRVERKDFFEQQTPWLDLTQYDPTKIINVCYTWTKRPRPSYGDFQYPLDGMDWIGSEAKGRWSDIVEWNNPYTPLQKGPLTVNLPFGAARFRGDAIERDVLSDYKSAPNGIGDAIKANEDVLLLNNGTASLPKLLILRDGWEADYTHCLVENKYQAYGLIDGSYVYPNEAYNLPMWFTESQQGQTLYDKFWKIENPKLSTFSGFDFRAEIEWTCEVLNAVNIDGTIQLTQGLGKVVTIDLDFSRNIMIIKGTV